MNNKNHFLIPASICFFTVLALLLLGCEPLDPGDNTASSQASVTILSNNGEDFVTEQETVALKGFAFNAVDVLVNDVSVDTLEVYDPGLHYWKTEVTLEEGENEFEVVALDDNNTRSNPAYITITHDPDHVPEAPENTFWKWYVHYTGKWQHNDSYDWGSSDDVHFKLETTSNVEAGLYCNNEDYFLELEEGDFITLCRGWITYAGNSYVGTKESFKLKATVWEEDGGLAGDDDPIGTGEITINFTFGTHTYQERTVNIDGNILTLTIIHGACSDDIDYCESH